VGDHGHVSSSQKSLHRQKQCAPAHSHGEATSPGSAIVPDVFGGLASSDASKPPGSNAGSPFGLEAQSENITNMLFMFDPRLNRENHSKVYVLPMALSPEALLSISCVFDAFSPSLKQNFTQMHCSFKSVISLITENRGSHLTRPKINAR
jgi:hypothetical protein